MDVFLSSALKCVGFFNGQPRIHQGNQIHGFGCPAFELGTTGFFLISSTESIAILLSHPQIVIGC